jgi:hypothetical protein
LATKAFHWFLLSILGYLVIILVFIMDIIRKLVLPFALGIQQLRGEEDDTYRRAEVWFRDWQKTMSGLTHNQLDQLTHSTKVSQMIFEDVP